MSPLLVPTDPLLFLEGLNLFRYAQNCPINLIDPSGEITPQAAIAIALLIACAGGGAAAQVAELVADFQNGNFSLLQLQCAGLAGCLTGLCAAGVAALVAGLAYIAARVFGGQPWIPFFSEAIWTFIIVNILGVGYGGYLACCKFWALLCSGCALLGIKPDIC